jgi:uncharacterized cupin superfamily protein
MTKDHASPVTIHANEVTPRTRSLYPEPFASMVAGRTKRALGDVFGLANFGVNLTRLAPGSRSALRHAHSRQDEFVFVLEGVATLITGAGESLLQPGMCAGFAAARGDAHHLFNRSDADVVYLEIGDRGDGDEVVYPDDDLAACMVDGCWQFSHKDGRPY